MNLFNKNKLRNSGLIFAFLFTFVFTVLPYLLHSSFKIFPLILSIFVIFFSILNPYILRGPLQIWLKIGKLLAKVNTTLILGIFFYVILFPSSIVRRLIVKILNLKSKKLTYYSRMNEIKSDFNEQF